ncbi:NUDIX hydrolase [Alicyclobacillus fodiniaquatilis]|uniref:NUDIX hydrolase n=1 Tax=Alicyclobacillus fodiniaquatilis TaxID=1661150 RepID=A0ABW4JES8_9BACL
MNELHLKQLTNKQPFCAGVILRDVEGIVVTLNPDGMPPDVENTAWRVGGVGGGQEPNESIWACALREAHEELSVAAELIHSPTTFFHDLDSGEISPVSVVDDLAPLLFERKTNPTPHQPYRPGLPTGPYIYFATFLAKVAHLEDIYPGDDVQALMVLPPTRWGDIEKGVTLQAMIDAGIRVICREGVDTQRRLWAPENESSATVMKLLQAHPSLFER